MLASNYLSPSLYSVLRSDVNIWSPLVSQNSDYWFRRLLISESGWNLVFTSRYKGNNSVILQHCRFVQHLSHFRSQFCFFSYAHEEQKITDVCFLGSWSINRAGWMKTSCRDVKYTRRLNMHNHRFAPLNLFLAQTQTPSILCFTLFRSLSSISLWAPCRHHPKRCLPRRHHRRWSPSGRSAWIPRTQAPPPAHCRQQQRCRES